MGLSFHTRNYETEKQFGPSRQLLQYHPLRHYNSPRRPTQVLACLPLPRFHSINDQLMI